jgi:hypothetical protein
MSFFSKLVGQSFLRKPLSQTYFQMRHFFTAFFIVAITFTFNSCDVCSCKKVLCSAFDDAHFNSWFPYNSNKTAVFKNSSGSADTIKFFAIEKSSSYEITRGCISGRSSNCTTNASIYADAKLSNTNTNISIYFTGYSEQSKNISFSFGDFRFQANDIANEGFSEISPFNYTAGFFAQLNINNTAFTNVQQITRDTTSGKEPGIYKLYLSRDNGIIAYEKYPSLDTFIKQ